MKPLSTLLTTMPPSATVAINDKAVALRAAGHDVLALAGGDPDFDTPSHIQSAAIAAIQAGDTHYPAPSRGTAAAVAAIAAKYERDTGQSADPDQIIVTPGGKWAIFLTLRAMLNAGDEVIYLEPAWVSYVPLIQLAGGVPVPVSLPSEENFRISAEIISPHITPHTKAIMLNSPSNPTGRVCTSAEIDVIAEIALAYDLYVICDELYEQLIFDGEHIPLASRPQMAERTITINGLSKGYAMTGWRLGWMVAPTPIATLAAKLHSQTVTCASSFGMTAIAAALNGSHEHVIHMREVFRQRRDYFVSSLNAIDGIECRSFEGAFYAFPRFTKTSLNSVEIADKLLDAGVAGTPGIAFGKSGEQHMRFALSTAIENLEMAVERMASVVPHL